MVVVTFEQSKNVAIAGTLLVPSMQLLAMRGVAYRYKFEVHSVCVCACMLMHVYNAKTNQEASLKQRF